MGTWDLRFGDALKLLVGGAIVGGVGLILLSQIESVKLKSLMTRRAYPSQFWDLRNPGQTSANFEKHELEVNNIPREGMFAANDPNFEEARFSGLEGYIAPRSL